MSNVSVDAPVSIRYRRLASENGVFRFNVAEQVIFRLLWRLPRQRSHWRSHMFVDGRMIPIVCGKTGFGGIARRVSDFPCTHRTVDAIARLFAAIALLALKRADAFPMAFLAANLPDPGVRDKLSLVALLAANADRAFLALSAMSRKRRYDDVDTDNAYSAAHVLFSQHTDCTGRPIKLSKRAVDVHADTMAIINRLSIPVATPTDDTLLIPIATVDNDNDELIFDRPGVPACTRGPDCIAHLIDGPPSKPLCAYRGVGHDPDCSECLLCIRHHICMIVQMHRTHGSRPPLGMLPPFSNIVDVPGGYRSSFCGVTPDDVELISGAVHIMGSPVSFKKAYNPYSRVWYVDQSAAVYGSSGFFF